MPVKERTPKERRHQLTHEQELSLCYGDLPGRPAFASDEERREAWYYHRDRLMQHGSCGRRVMAWWRYESPFPWPGRDHEHSALFRANLLSEAEASELVAWWRAEFAKRGRPASRLAKAPEIPQGAAE